MSENETEAPAAGRKSTAGAVRPGDGRDRLTRRSSRPPSARCRRGSTDGRRSRGCGTRARGAGAGARVRPGRAHVPRRGSRHAGRDGKATRQNADTDNQPSQRATARQTRHARTPWSLDSPRPPTHAEQAIDGQWHRCPCREPLRASPRGPPGSRPTRWISSLPRRTRCPAPCGSKPQAVGAGAVTEPVCTADIGREPRVHRTAGDRAMFDWLACYESARRARERQMTFAGATAAPTPGYT